MRSSASGSTGATTSAGASSANRSRSLPAAACIRTRSPTRVREAQSEWSRLDAAEGHAGGAQVHTATTAGRAVSMPHAGMHWSLRNLYFKKRQELRKAHAEESPRRSRPCGAIPADSSDWPQIAKTRHAVVDALRSLDRIDPHERKTLAKNLKAALTAIDARLDSRHAEIERQSRADRRSGGAWRRRAAARRRGDRARAAATLARRRQRPSRSRSGAMEGSSALRSMRCSASSTPSVRSASNREAGCAHARERIVRRARSACEGRYARRSAPPSRRSRANSTRCAFATKACCAGSARRNRRLRDAGMRRERSSRRGPYDAWLARYALCRVAERAEQPTDELSPPGKRRRAARSRRPR